MRKFAQYAPFHLLALLCISTGCSENPLMRAPIASHKSADEQTDQQVSAETAEAIVAAAETEITDRATVDQSDQRFGHLFASVLPTLERARELVDRHDKLPDKSRLPFRADKQSNAADLNELLDRAIETLGISEVTDYRQRIREATEAIANAHAKIADYQRQRVSAPWAKEQSQLDKVNPFKLSKEAMDERISDEHAKIKQQEETLAQLRTSFAKELSAIGVEVDEAGVDALLSSVSGDDLVTMAVVFDNIKQLTAQFQELTDESGEALDTAKRYYGMYVVMIHVMDRIQDTFVREIREQHIPKLKAFAAQADRNIAEARDLLDAKKGDPETLQANIASNQLTHETADLYVEYLEQNAELIAAENKSAQANLATAMNTYNTVKLSSDVAALMNTGRRNFDTLMRIRIPALREFNNEAIRKEFQRMTLELRSGV